MKLYFFTLVLGITLLHTTESLSQVTLQHYEQMRVDATIDPFLNPKMVNLLQKYREPMLALVNRRIGYNPVVLTSRAPESLLSNFLADILYKESVERSTTKIDAAVLNLGGIRASLPSGQITVGDLYRVFPFENELVFVSLKGSVLSALLDQIAKSGGEGLSNIRFEIHNGKAQNATIGGQAIHPDTLYTLATMDYLSKGGSGMSAMLKAEGVVETHQKIRDAYIHQIELLTAQGKNIESRIDGRIKSLTK